MNIAGNISLDKTSIFLYSWRKYVEPSCRKFFLFHGFVWISHWWIPLILAKLGPDPLTVPRCPGLPHIMCFWKYFVFPNCIKNITGKYSKLNMGKEPHCVTPPFVLDQIHTCEVPLAFSVFYELGAELQSMCFNSLNNLNILEMHSFNLIYLSHLSFSYSIYLSIWAWSIFNQSILKESTKHKNVNTPVHIKIAFVQAKINAKSV